MGAARVDQTTGTHVGTVTAVTKSGVVMVEIPAVARGWVVAAMVAEHVTAVTVRTVVVVAVTSSEAVVVGVVRRP